MNTILGTSTLRPSRRWPLVLTALTLIWFALLPAARPQACDSACPSGGNTSLGVDALFHLSGGHDDTALGFGTLYYDMAGSNNTASGSQALGSNTADNNTATGYKALFSNTVHAYNTAIGSEALLNADADDNTAIGGLALHSDTSGYYNTATGVSALFSNNGGYYNTATGVSALYFNAGGHDNTAHGLQALLHSTGSNNVAVGSNAGANLTTGNNNIDIGTNVVGLAGEANTIRIGKSGTQQKTFIAGIYGKTVATGVGVMINSTGQLGTVQSSARFKDGIKPVDNASQAILALKPVTFHYKKELDPEGVPQFGLIAEDVEKVNPDLVVRDEDGKPMTVRYDAVNAMLLNEFLKEHRKVEQMQKQIDALTAVVQKVSAQLEINSSRPQTVRNNYQQSLP